jgi:hypothetical protein
VVGGFGHLLGLLCEMKKPAPSLNKPGRARLECSRRRGENERWVDYRVWKVLIKIGIWVGNKFLDL